MVESGGNGIESGDDTCLVMKLYTTSTLKDVSLYLQNSVMNWVKHSGSIVVLMDACASIRLQNG